MLLAVGRASAAARPSAGRSGQESGSGCPAHSVRAVGRRQPGWRGPDSALQPRPGGGLAEASAACARLPAPAGRCLRARRARGGGWGAPGESREEGGQERAGRSGSGRRLAGSKLGLNTPGAVSLLLLLLLGLHARRPELAERGRGRAGQRGRALSLGGDQVWRMV